MTFFLKAIQCMLKLQVASINHNLCDYAIKLKQTTLCCSESIYIDFK